MFEIFFFSALKYDSIYALNQDGRIQLTVDSGETVALSCQSLQGIPASMLWSWMRDYAVRGIAYNSGLIVDQRTKYGVEYDTGENFATSVLTIRSLTAEDQGEYSCQADNETPSSVDIVVRGRLDFYVLVDIYSHVCLD